MLGWLFYIVLYQVTKRIIAKAWKAHSVAVQGTKTIMTAMMVSLQMFSILKDSHAKLLRF